MTSPFRAGRVTSRASWAAAPSAEGGTPLIRSWREATLWESTARAWRWSSLPPRAAEQGPRRWVIFNTFPTGAGDENLRFFNLMIRSTGNSSVVKKNRMLYPSPGSTRRLGAASWLQLLGSYLRPHGPAHSWSTEGPAGDGRRGRVEKPLKSWGHRGWGRALFVGGGQCLLALRLTMRIPRGASLRIFYKWALRYLLRTNWREIARKTFPIYDILMSHFFPYYFHRSIARPPRAMSIPEISRSCQVLVKNGSNKQSTTKNCFKNHSGNGL